MAPPSRGAGNRPCPIRWVTIHSVHRSRNGPHQRIDQSIEVDGMATDDAIDGEAAIRGYCRQDRTKRCGTLSQGFAVAYPTHGVGRIDRIGLEEIVGHGLNLIYISCDNKQMTLR